MNRICWILLIVVNFSLLAQQKDFVFYDRKTYEFYLNQQWDSVIVYGKDALQSGYDYYYLRMRLGIARYLLEKYDDALEDFQKALDHNASDDAYEYLYYTLRQLGRYRDAYYLSKYFSPDLLKKLDLIPPQLIDQAVFSLTLSKITNWDSLKAFHTPPDNNYNYTMEKTLTGNSSGGETSLRLNLSKTYSLLTSLSFYDIQGYQQLYYDHQIQHEYDYMLKDIHLYTALTHWKKNHSMSWFFHFNRLVSKNFAYKLVDVVVLPNPNADATTYVYDIDLVSMGVNSFAFGGVRSFYKARSFLSLSGTLARIVSEPSISAGLMYGYSFARYFSGTCQLGVTKFLKNAQFNAFLRLMFDLSFKRIQAGIYFLFGHVHYSPSFDAYFLYTSDETLRWQSGTYFSFKIFKPLSFLVSYTLQDLFYDNHFQRVDQVGMWGKVSFSSHAVRQYFRSSIINGGIIWKM